MLIKKIGFAVVFGVMLFLLPVCINITSVYAQEKSADNSAATLDNLMTAYNGEVNANARYIAFSKSKPKRKTAKMLSMLLKTQASPKVFTQNYTPGC